MKMMSRRVIGRKAQIGKGAWNGRKSGFSCPGCSLPGKKAAGITPQDAALRKPTLDEAFLALTGHHTSASDRARPVEAAR